MNERKSWLAWRHLGLGGSDSASVHNESPYKTRFQLWEEKIQTEYIEAPMNWAQQKGTDLEPKARAIFAAGYNMDNGGDETFEAARVEMVGLPYLRASLDGFSKCKTKIVEFKYQGKETHESKEIPRHYWLQIQHCLLVSQATLAYFVSFDGESVHSQIVMPDLEFHAKHLDECMKFWTLVTNKVPPELSDKDYKELRFKGATEKARAWRKAKLAMETAKAEMESIRDEILSLVNHPRMMIGDVKIIQMPGRQGAINYEAIPALKGIDLDRYRKPDGKPFYMMK